MPSLLLSFKRNSDSHLLIHSTLAPNDSGAEKDMEGHAKICPQFGPAYTGDETIQVMVDVDSIPEFNQQAIEAWVDDLFGIDPDDEEEDEEDDEEEEEEEDDER